MKVYIAAPYELRNEAISVMHVLEADARVRVTSSWLREVHKNDDRSARMDLLDIIESDVLLLLNPASFQNSGSGGRHVEFGYAQAMGKRLVILGVRSNIFHHLSDVRVIERLEDL